MDEVTVGGLYFTVHRPPPDLLPRTATHLPLLLLHGWLGTSLSLRPVAAALAARGHTVLSPDLPYHGRSHAIAPPSPRAAAALAAAAAASVLASLHLPAAAAVVGYSLGGRIALELAALPQRDSPLAVRALVLVSSGLPPPDDAAAAAAAARHARLAAAVRSKRTRAALRAWLRDEWYTLPLWGGLDAAPGFDALLDLRVAALLPVGAGAALIDAGACAAEALSPAAMTRGLAVPQALPVLFMYGERDAKYAGASGDVKRLFAPQAAVARVSDAGHNVFLQQLERAAAAVAKFVSPVARGGGRPFVLRKVRMVRYLVPLKRAMRVAGRLVTARSGVLVALLGDEGACGVGDVAPLPGLHAEALSHCVQEVCQWSARRLRRAGDELSANDPHVSVSDVIEGDGWLGPESPSLSPSTRSALSAALAQCVAMVNGMDVDDFLCAAHGRYEPCERRIAYNGVAPRPPGAAGGGDVARERAHSALLAAGCARVLKLKVGHTGSVDDDAAAVALLVASLRDSDCLLRIDANCSWSAEQFSLFCAQTRACGDVIEYVEEPIAVKTPEEMVRFCHDVYGDDGCCGRPPLGLDESLVQFSLSETVSLAVAPGVGAIVLKPSVQGDLCRMFRLARVAESRDVKVILSSVFDSGVGLAWAAVLASAIGHPRSASHGIGTFTSLARDAVSPSFEEFCVSRSDAKIRVSDCKQLLTREARAVLKEGCNPAHLEDSLRGMPEHTRR